MASSVLQSGASGTVVVYPIRRHVPAHERAVHLALAQRIAALQGRRVAPDLEQATQAGGPTYLIPTATVVGAEKARELRIDGESDLFGAVVPHAFVATKAISHPLLSADSQAPEGWSAEFSASIESATLRGWTVFNLEDAKEAGRRMLAHGPVRIKPVQATGGRGQSVARDETTLLAALHDLETDDLPVCGLVLEEHLEDVTTYSVGQVRIAGMVASYWGTQRLTPDSRGELVYGGSELRVVRGDFERLLALNVDERVLTAIRQAHTYDEQASRCFPGLIASRRNYDIAHGTDAGGMSRSGVLEQSWRIGGASSAEIAALEIFRERADVDRVSASSVEIYGEDYVPPPGATVFFRGVDEEVGFITKFVMVGAYGNAQ